MADVKALSRQRFNIAAPFAPSLVGSPFSRIQQLCRQGEAKEAATLGPRNLKCPEVPGHCYRSGGWEPQAIQIAQDSPLLQLLSAAATAAKKGWLGESGPFSHSHSA